MTKGAPEIPKTIQVGAIPYTVVVDEAAINKACVQSQSGRFGEHDASKQQISTLLQIIRSNPGLVSYLQG